MQKKCLYCGNLYTKKSTCSLKDWSNQKYCSVVCCDKSKVGRPNPSKTKFVKGQLSWRKGLKMNDEQIERQKLAMRKFWDSSEGMIAREKIRQHQIGRPTGRTGDKCNFWKGGKTEEYRKLKNSIEWKNWRRAVFERDDYTCQDCGIRNEKGLGRTIQMHPHHLKLQSKFPKLRFVISNGITLCNDCHGIRHSKPIN
jgi:5-methylcytosine-specific restriction endonuclease McrA